MTVRARHVLAALAVGLTLIAAGCGSSSEEEPEQGAGLPQSFVDQLEPRLEEVQRRYDDGVENGNPGACEDIASDSFGGPGGIDEVVAGLPSDVDPDLRQAVERSVERLRELTDDCVEKADAAAEEAAPAPVPEEEYEPPPETTPETTPEPEPKKDKDRGNDNGGPPTPEPTPAPEPAPEQELEVPPGEGGGVPAPAPRGQQGSKKDEPPNDGKSR